MLSSSSSNNDDKDSSITDLLYDLCRENGIEKARSILPCIDNINIINKIQNSTCLHVACYYGHRHMVPLLLQYEALHSIRNLRHNLTPYEEACRDGIKQLFVEHCKLFSNNNFDYDYVEWSVVGDNLFGKRREFRQAMDLYKVYNNHHLVSKLLAEVIHYYLNEYMINQSNDTDNPEDQISRQQIEIIDTYFKEAIEKQDYLTYFIKAYTLTNCFYKVLKKHMALYILQYFDKTKDFLSNYRFVNCLIHIVTLLIYHPNLPQYRYQGLCYRGMRITQNDLNQYLSNQHILNRSFLSTSIDREVAEMFAGEGQQSKMRYTPKNHCELQYSCLCQYLIKQNSTAINIQSLSTRSDEKEILILPFTVFKVIAIKRNYLDDPKASFSIEIELEECEDTNDNKNESENCSNILERSSWNASPSKGLENFKKLPVTHIVPHQILGYNSIMNHQDCIKQIKKVQDDHMNKQDWDDIGYNFILCGDNDDQQQIYTGRGWNFTGAHCKTYNNRSLASKVLDNLKTMLCASGNIIKPLNDLEERAEQEKGSADKSTAKSGLVRDFWDLVGPTKR
ncbi:unnamed protein product [Rotaria sordida]|uniref:Peptidoglycan recognition protein family domain-containing protein n=1 Tax=Rotaria sordida TaxID=392033 RepID=A0A818V2H8_9BILA|nr:unnamed protein product [Rotaria sordida]